MSIHEGRSASGNVRSSRGASGLRWGTVHSFTVTAILTGALFALQTFAEEEEVDEPGLEAAATAQNVTRIISIRGDEHPNHEKIIEVEPEEIVDLSSDVLDRGKDYEQENVDVDEFEWSAYPVDTRGRKSGEKEVCNIKTTPDCLETSNFEATDFGVNYYVPKDMEKDIRVVVRTSDRDLSRTYDAIILRNKLRKENQPYSPPTQVVSSFEEYHYPTYDHTHALAGLGRWVWIGGEKFWSPYLSDSEWAPYTNGYMSWVDGVEVESGLTWVGYDSFSYVTDHYGVWRYHGVYGWVWYPFPTNTYVRAAITTYYTDGIVGWYPYHHAFREGYVLGAAVGFLDGFSAGFEAGYEAAERDHYYGHVCVRNSDFGSVNVYNVRIKDTTVIKNYYVNAYHSHHYGQHLGGNNVNETNIYIKNVVKVNVPRTQVNVKVINNVKVVNVQHAANHPIPENIKASVSVKEHARRPIPVASIVKAPANPHDAPVIVKPTQGHHGLAAAPRVVNQKGEAVEVAARTKNPAKANDTHPVSHTQPQRKAPSETAKMPKYDPKPNAPVHHPIKQDPKNPQPPAPATPTPAKPSKPEPKPEHPSKPEPKPEHPSKPEPKPEHPSKPEPKPEHPSKPEPKPEHPSKPEPKPEHPSKPEPKPEHPSKPEPKPEHPSKPEPKPEHPSKPEPKPEHPSKPEPKPEHPSKPEPKPEHPSKPEPKPEHPSKPKDGKKLIDE